MTDFPKIKKLKLSPEYLERIEIYKNILFDTVSISNSLDAKLEIIIYQMNVINGFPNKTEEEELKIAFKDKVGIINDFLFQYDTILSNKFKSIKSRLDKFNVFRNRIVHGNLTGNFKTKNTEIILVLRSLKLYDEINKHIFHRNYFKFTHNDILKKYKASHEAYLILKEVLDELKERTA